MGGHTMIFGNFELNALDTSLFALDGGAMFGVVPKPLWSKAYHRGDELNRIPVAARPLLVRPRSGDHGRCILIDTGNGALFDDKTAGIYCIDQSKSSVLPALERLGLNAGDITDVILTHLHFDHAGGTVTRQSGKLLPAFPNARYHVQKEHAIYARRTSEKDRASFNPDSFLPLFSEGLVELTDGAARLFEGISVVPANGHTVAMQVVKIESEGRSLIFCADLVPTSTHLHLPYVMSYDNFPLTTIEEKKRLLNDAVRDKSILYFEHDAFMCAATIEPGPKGYRVKEKIEIL